MTLRVNYEDVVMISVIGEITSLRHAICAYDVSHAGEALVLMRWH